MCHSRTTTTVGTWTGEAWGERLQTDGASADADDVASGGPLVSGDSTIERVLSEHALRSVFQPIVDLDSGAVVAYEALVRGPEGPLQGPDALFAAARAAGLLAELDAACRLSAFRAAADHGIFDPVALFVNVEPEVLDAAPLDDLVAVMARAAGKLRIVLEITERSIAARPAHLLRTVERVRSLGWGIALDDVGADSASLAFMPLLRPDVVKLDLRLVQERPGPAIAEIMNAVNAYAERSGALVLAEGIEDERHLLTAQALGARLGQGWLFGRPTAAPVPVVPAVPMALLDPAAHVAAADRSPFSCLPPGTPLRRSAKRLLIELSKQLEREAMRIGETCVVAATFQEARHLTPATTARYRDLADRVGFVAAIGEGLPQTPVEGVRGADLSSDDPVRGEWDVAVIGPHFAAALLARDLGDHGPDLQRTFEFALTYDREVVAAAARSLLARVAPRVGAPAERSVLAAVVPAPRAGAALAAALPVVSGSVPGGGLAGETLQRALAASTSGITISDMLRPDHPLVYVNHAFESLSGLPAEEVLGRNCRFLQSPDSDPATVARIRAAVAAGEEITETLLNVRGPERTPWWNDLHLAPVRDDAGRVVQYIGVQTDVTATVEAERALRDERDRAHHYLSRLEELASTDPLTGLLNRRSLEERLEVALWEARARGEGVALLFCDLDGFKPVNDSWGHAAGDELLRTVARRLRGQLRRGDLIARPGGDEFIVVLTGLAAASAHEHATAVAATMVDAVSAPVLVGGVRVSVGVSIGVSASPADGDDFSSLFHAADLRMYARKRAAAGSRDR